MKFFLTSYGLPKVLADELSKLSGQALTSLKLVVIANAADPYPLDNRHWAEQERAQIASYGINIIDLDLREYRGRRAELRSLLLSQDVIWVGGGNTFYLRWLVSDVGADDLLRAATQAGVVYAGSSAGSILAGPTLKHIELIDDPAAAPKLISEGLGMTDVVVVPHLNDQAGGPTFERIASLLEQEGHKVHRLVDGQAVVINTEDPNQSGSVVG